MNKTLSHLSPEQVNEVITKYYDGEKIQKILDDYHINVVPSVLVTLFPKEVHADLFCPYCHINLETKRASRHHTMYTRYSYCVADKYQPKCPSCDHKETENCRCSSCKELKEAETRLAEENKEQTILRTYDNNGAKCPDIKDISLYDAVFLLSVIAHSGSEDLRYVFPFHPSNLSLAPTNDLSNFMIKHLYERSFIQIDSYSEVDAFVFSEDGNSITSYAPDKVLWKLLPNMDINEKKDYLYKIQEIIDSNKWSELWKQQIPLIWRQITKHKCFAHYFYLIKERNYNLPDIGEKTHTTFEHMLNRFTLAQSFTLIHRSIRYTNDYLTTKRPPKYKEKNMWIGGIQRTADKYYAEGWELETRINFHCTQTVLGSTFFDTFMKTGKKSLNKTYSEIIDLALSKPLST